VSRRPRYGRSHRLLPLALLLPALLLAALLLAACDREPAGDSGPLAAPAVPAPSGPVVRTGLDRVASGDAELPAGRLGLVAHAASLTADGVHAIDVLRARGLDLVRLFGPEHGLRGEAAAGEEVAGGVDPATGLPVVSLYGAQRQPSAEDLADLDVLVLDLQDAGVRFYTYVSTLMLCLEAAAEHGVTFVVLDRPNPLGGERVEGPVSAPREVVPESFVNMAPGPLVHGLTFGEIARLVNAALPEPADLVVVEMEGWERAMAWPDTGLPWVAPSPNLRTAEAALAYPGTALLEATTVSEGRGTEAPFLRLGAPWLDAGRLAAELAELGVADFGFAVRTTRFTPRASAAAPDPKHLDEECAGLEVAVTDPAAASPYRFGLALLVALRDEPGFAWRGEGWLARLTGDAGLAAAVEAGLGVDDLWKRDAAGSEEWRRARAPFLLYPSGAVAVTTPQRASGL
jgi:uncharacterized protein YbbC (DUF1343 family)